jgi:hypothetical protein
MLGDIVEEQVEVERQRLGDAVLRVMGGEVVVPLPGLTRGGGLGVDLDLLDIELVGTENLPGGLDEPRVMAETGENIVPKVEAHHRPDLMTRLLSDVRWGVLGEQAGQLGA